jgi:hypothetical protein
VIPQAFGRFADNNLIALNVCDRCNEFFDRELDRVLARGTYEGFMRFRLRDRQPSEYRHVGRASRVRFVAKQGPWTEMILDQVPAADGSALLVEPAKQLGFSASEDEAPTYYRPDDAPTREECAELYGNDLHVRSIGFDSTEEIESLLRGLGFENIGPLTVDWGAVGAGVVRVEQTIRADRLVFRCVAKIAVNYLDAVHPEVSRMAVFNAIARFVRYDEEPPWQPVSATLDPIIGNEPSGGRYLGHVVTLRQDPASRRIVANVSLYNQIRYDVVLSPAGFQLELPSEWLTLGHLFDTKNGVLRELTHSSLQAQRLLLPTP